jgi:hypothetical protein
LRFHFSYSFIAAFASLITLRLFSDSFEDSIGKSVVPSL